MKKNNLILASIEDLKFKRRNPRKHNDRNLEIIERSITKNGAARSVVVDETGELLAGNGTVVAAKRAGIKKIKPVEANGDELVVVIRRGLSKAQKEDLVIADNRASDTSEFDSEILKRAFEKSCGTDYFSPEEIKCLSRISPNSEDQEPNSPERIKEQFLILIECRNEKQQFSLLKKFNKENLKCRALVS